MNIQKISASLTPEIIKRIDKYAKKEHRGNRSAAIENLSKTALEIYEEGKKAMKIIILFFLLAFNLHAEVWHKNGEPFNAELIGTEGKNALFLSDNGTVLTVPASEMNASEIRQIRNRLKQHKILLNSQKQQYETQKKLFSAEEHKKAVARAKEFLHFLEVQGKTPPDPKKISMSDQLKLDKYKKGLLPLKEMDVYEEQIVKQLNIDTLTPYQIQIKKEQQEKLNKKLENWRAPIRHY